MKTKKIVINFVGVSMAVAVRAKGQAGMSKQQSHEATKKEPEKPLVPLFPGC
jgi:hypothetical protein